MVRKRDAWTRAGDRLHIRPKTPAPKHGWLISELASLSGQRPRTVSYYVQQGLLAKPAFRGTATRYGRIHLLRLLCIGQLQRAGAGTLQQIRRRLDAMSEGELLATVTTQPPSAALATALGLPPPQEAPPAPASSASNGSPAANAPALPAAPAANVLETTTAKPPGEVWHRVSLLPGLELWLAEEASPAVRHIARQIQTYCTQSRASHP